ncbi:CHC2 zinc finger domain-containing protein [Tellurirhabdus rosea]|uniref:CHC2 zinc finger domain-containing protein n=1 Tax=Tellurirhabdus rosea TaxID=2674997 RepID=UPI00224F5A64|nr:CHC2 zinc finger domain-containing protein [Tellurirhabdus rosea]
MDLLTKVRGIEIGRVVSDLGFTIRQFRKICCPFHEEKTPSLVLYPQTNTYHCFGCGRHGDVIHFYAGISKQEYTSAMHELAFNYLPDYRPELYKRGHLKKIAPLAPGPAKRTLPPDTKTYTYQLGHSVIYEDFQRFCNSLPPSPVREEALDYLRGRSFEDRILRQFRLFIVSDYEAAQAHLRNTWALADLQECGLFNEKGNLIFYRHVIIIPYYREGRIVFLQGRIVGNPTDAYAKYQFLSGVPVELFNADVLKQVRTGQTVYLTEGAFDAMALVQEGLAAVSLGSATLFKREWAKLFQRVKVCFYFDNDRAGQKAAKDFADVLSQYRIEVVSKTVPDGFKDINEYLASRR